MGIPSVSDSIRGRLEEEHRRLDAAGDLLSREALDGNYKRFAESIDRADRAAEAVQDRTRSASLDSASCDARTTRRTVRPESCRRYDEDAPPGRGDASPSATTHERVSILLR